MSDLRALIDANPRWTNQDLINHLYDQSDNTWNGAARLARQFNLDGSPLSLDRLVGDRGARLAEWVPTSRPGASAPFAPGAALPAPAAGGATIRPQTGALREAAEAHELRTNQDMINYLYERGGDWDSAAALAQTYGLNLNRLVRNREAALQVPGTVEPPVAQTRAPTMGEPPATPADADAGIAAPSADPAVSVAPPPAVAVAEPDVAPAPPPAPPAAPPDADAAPPPEPVAETDAAAPSAETRAPTPGAPPAAAAAAGSEVSPPEPAVALEPPAALPAPGLPPGPPRLADDPAGPGDALVDGAAAEPAVAEAAEAAPVSAEEVSEALDRIGVPPLERGDASYFGAQRMINMALDAAGNDELDRLTLDGLEGPRTMGRWNWVAGEMGYSDGDVTSEEVRSEEFWRSFGTYAAENGFGDHFIRTLEAGQMSGIASYLHELPPTGAVPRATLDLPERPEGAPTGTEFMAEIGELSPATNPEDRRELEGRVLHEILSGNVPSHLREMVPVPFEFPGGTEDESIEGEIFTLPDYLAIGSDDDYAIIPLRGTLAQQIADATGTTLPTARMVDLTYEAAETADRRLPLIGLYGRVDELPSRAPNDFSAAMQHPLSWQWHNEQLAALDGPRAHDGGGLVAGHRKDVVMSSLSLDGVRAEHVVIYGGHGERGVDDPTQPLTDVHDENWNDYIQALRPYGPETGINGQSYDIDDILTHPHLAHALFDDAERPTRGSALRHGHLTSIPEYDYDPATSVPIAPDGIDASPVAAPAAAPVRPLVRPELEPRSERPEQGEPDALAAGAGEPVISGPAGAEADIPPIPVAGVENRLGAAADRTAWVDAMQRIEALDPEVRDEYLTLVDQRAYNLLNLGTRTRLLEDGVSGGQTVRAIAALTNGEVDDRSVQAGLRALDFLGADGNPLTLDGAFGRNSEHALGDFRQSVGYTAESSDPVPRDYEALRAALGELDDPAAAAVLADLQPSSDVVLPNTGVQVALDELGFRRPDGERLGIDGAFGGNSEFALGEFRRARGYNADSPRPTARDTVELFAALQEHILVDEQWMLDVDYDYFDHVAHAGGSRHEDEQNARPLSELLDVRLSAFYSLDELVGYGADSRVSLLGGNAHRITVEEYVRSGSTAGLGEIGLHPENLRMMDRATALLQRDYPGVRFRFLSTDRGYPSNRHKFGWATDPDTAHVFVDGYDDPIPLSRAHQPAELRERLAGLDQEAIMAMFLRVGATSVGVYPSFIHADVDPRDGVVWRQFGSGASGSQYAMRNRLTGIYW